MEFPSSEQRIIREISKRGTCSPLDLKSVLGLSLEYIMGITARLADRRSVRIKKDQQGGHMSYTWTGPKEKAPEGKRSHTKKPPPSSPDSALPAQPTWKTKAAEKFRDAPKLAIEFQRYINRLDAPCMEALAREIGTDHMVSALCSCFFSAPEIDAVIGPDTSFPPDAYDMRAAAKKAAALAKFVAKHEISNADFVGALNSFSHRMDEGAISHGRPRKWAGGYSYGGIILPRPQGKGKRINSEVWGLVKTLEYYFRQNLKNHPHHRAIAVLCSATFGKNYTEGAIKKILERWKKESVRPLIDPNIRDSLTK